MVPGLHNGGADARTLREAHKRQVAFLGINTEDSKQGARAFYKRYDTEYPSIWDPRGVLAGAWSRGAPTTLVFDRRHVLVQRIEGSASLAQLNPPYAESPDDAVSRVVAANVLLAIFALALISTDWRRKGHAHGGLGDQAPPHSLAGGHRGVTCTDDYDDH